VPVASRRGVTLIELLIAMVVAAILGSMVLGATATVTAVLRGRVERVGAAVAARAVWGLVRLDWASLGTDSVGGPDLGAPSAASADYRADRGLAAVCRLLPDTVVLASGRLHQWGPRRPAAARDSLLLYAAGDSAARIDAWVPIPLLSGPAGVSCPSGEPGDQFVTRLDSATLARYRLRSPAVARVVEFMRARSYGTGTLWQFGLEGLSAGALVQPVASNLAGGSGFSIVGWGCDGLATAWPLLCGFDLGIRTTTRRDLGLGAGQAAAALDSINLSVRFENWP